MGPRRTLALLPALGPDRYLREPSMRIGANQYRLAMPWPKQESKLDLLELRR